MILIIKHFNDVMLSFFYIIDINWYYILYQYAHLKLINDSICLV